MTDQQIDRMIQQVAEATAPVRMFECDCCMKMKPRKDIAFIVAYGMDTYACKECRHDDEPESGE